MSSFQGSECKQSVCLGQHKLSQIERCPHFKVVLIEGFHYITRLAYDYEMTIKVKCNIQMYIGLLGSMVSESI